MFKCLNVHHLTVLNSTNLGICHVNTNTNTCSRYGIELHINLLLIWLISLLQYPDCTWNTASSNKIFNLKAESELLSRYLEVPYIQCTLRYCSLDIKRDIYRTVLYILYTDYIQSTLFIHKDEVLKICPEVAVVIQVGHGILKWWLQCVLMKFE